MQAVVLAGGLGSRLGAASNGRPKPLVDINGTPFATLLLRELSYAGIRQTLVLAGHLPEQIISWAETVRENFDVVVEVTPTHFSPAERLRAAWDNLDDVFVLVYGDNLPTIPAGHFETLTSSEAGRLLLAPKCPGNVNLHGRRAIYSPQRSLENQHVEVGFAVLRKETLGFYLMDCLLELPRALEALSNEHFLNYTSVEGYRSVSDEQRLEETRAFFNQKFLFLDRDGILNEALPRWEYVTDESELRFPSPDVGEKLGALSRSGWKFVIVSNQAGVDRGVLSLEQLESLTIHLQRYYRRFGVHFSGVYYCVHGWQSSCTCRKPKPGLFLKAAESLGIPLSSSWIVGDSCSDVTPLVSRGGRGIHVSSGGRKENCQCSIVLDSVEEALDRVGGLGQ